MKKGSYYFFIVLFAITACDFRLPQDWENPEWHLPLSVPLYNDSITIGDMINTGYNCYGVVGIDEAYAYETLAECELACHTEENIEYGCKSIFSLEPNINDDSYHISIDTTVIEKDSISISDEYFYALQPDGLEFSIDIGMDPIQIEIPPNASVDESKFLSITDFIDEDISYDCVPDSIYSKLTPYTLDPIYIDVYAGIDVESIQYLNAINSIIINQGQVSLEINNELPFLIKSVELDFQDENDETWVDVSLSDIDCNENGLKNISLESEIVPSNITVIPTIFLSQPTNLESCPFYLPLSDIQDQIEGLYQSVGVCGALQQQGVIDNTCDCIFSPETCSLEIDNKKECKSLETIYNASEDPDVSLAWDNSECKIDTGLLGYEYNGNEQSRLEIDYSFTISEAEADVSIILQEEISDSQTIEFADGIELISARLADAYNSLDENMFAMNFSNNLFAPIDLSIILNDFYSPDDTTSATFEISNCDCSEYDNENLCSSCGSEWEIISLSNYFIGHPNSQEIIDEIRYTVRYSIIDPNVIIKMNQQYDFEVSNIELKPLRFESLKVNLERFESPPIEMGDIPVGFEGFELPTLSFDLKFYNEINAPLTLMLDLIGVSDDSPPIVIHVEPELAYFGTTASPIDSSILTIDNNQLIVQQNLSGDIISTSYPFGEDANGEQLSIYDIFAADNIQVEGYAVLSGASTLEPGKSVWADMEVNIDPLTIIITEDISFISESPTILEPIDATTSEKIDSGIVSATVNLEFENAIPLDGTLDMIVSNSDKFPPCLDKLRTGIFLEQNDLITTSCYNYINSSFNLSDNDSIVVDLRSDDNFYYIEFQGDNNTTFFGKFLNMQLVLPDEINNGIVVHPSTYTESLNLLGDEVKWLTNDDNLYIAPQVILSSYDDSNPNDDGRRTLLATSYLKINSLLTFILDMGEISETQDQDHEKNKNK